MDTKIHNFSLRGGRAAPGYPTAFGLRFSGFSSNSSSLIPYCLMVDVFIMSQSRNS